MGSVWLGGMREEELSMDLLKGKPRASPGRVEGVSRLTSAGTTEGEGFETRSPVK